MICFGYVIGCGFLGCDIFSQYKIQNPMKIKHLFKNPNSKIQNKNLKKYAKKYNLRWFFANLIPIRIHASRWLLKRSEGAGRVEGEGRVDEEGIEEREGEGGDTVEDRGEGVEVGRLMAS